MIKIQKGIKPEVLVQNERAWTDEYLALLALNDTEAAKKLKYRYRDPEIKKL